VATGEYEARLLVFGQAERRRLVSLQIVAAIAGIEVWRRRKLSCMLVAVAISAAFELDLK